MKSQTSRAVACLDAAGRLARVDIEARFAECVGKAMVEVMIQLAGRDGCSIVCDSQMSRFPFQSQG
jgi:hypothetical protein